MQTSLFTQGTTANVLFTKKPSPNPVFRFGQSANPADTISFSRRIALKPYFSGKETRAKIEALEKELGYPLFEFQKKAIESLDDGKSVIVSAPTSSGKTLVAEFAVRQALEARKNNPRSGKRVIYTAPLKAISNEKYREFLQKYNRSGEKNIGLLTGDNTINPDAPVVIMTTEILRNGLAQPEQGKHLLEGVETIVIDESHTIGDPERGVAYEQTILDAGLDLPGIQQIHLSATFPNADQYARWANQFKNSNSAKTPAGQFDLITSDKRPVPLVEQYFYLSPDGEGKLIGIRGENGEISSGFKKKFHEAETGKSFNAVAVTKALKKADQLPAIIFAFSQKGCEKYANAILNANLNLTTPEEKEKITRIIDTYKTKYPLMAVTRNFQSLEKLLKAGIGYHHAGMFPGAKEIVEVLMKKKLLKVVAGTHTLAMGINVPFRTVVVSQTEVRTMEGTFPLSPKDYEQLSGRPGRLGMDKQGYIVFIQPEDGDMDRITSLVASEPSPIQSRMRILPHLSLNYLKRFDGDIRKVQERLDQSFKHFQQEEADSAPGTAKGRINALLGNLGARIKGNNDEDPSLRDDFNRMVLFLQKEGFLAKNANPPELSNMGELTSHVPTRSSLLISKAIEQKILQDLGPAELAGVLAATITDKPGKEEIDGADITTVVPEALKGPIGELKTLREELLAVAGNTQYNVDPDIRLAGKNAGKIVEWCKSAENGDVSLLEDNPGELTYLIRNTVNLIENILEAREAKVRKLSALLKEFPTSDLNDAMSQVTITGSTLDAVIQVLQETNRTYLKDYPGKPAPLTIRKASLVEQIKKAIAEADNNNDAFGTNLKQARAMLLKGIIVEQNNPAPVKIDV